MKITSIAFFILFRLEQMISKRPLLKIDNLLAEVILDVLEKHGVIYLELKAI